MNKKIILFLAAIILLPLFPCAKEMPYYASIKGDEANIRSGPSVRYPIQWIYKRRNWPVQVTATFERWRKISDVNGEIGWVHEGLLSARRYAVIKTEGVQEVYRLPLLTSARILVVENGVVIELEECKNNWCKIRLEHRDGWIQDKHLWGVGKGEVVG